MTTTQTAIMVSADAALPGRDTAVTITHPHYVTGAPLQAPFPAGTQTAVLRLGCFWGAERLFRRLDGVVSTALNYARGFSQNPSCDEACSGLTGHAEVVLVIFDPERISYARLLQVFFESHNPAHGLRQGNDRGTQYRSVIQYANAEQHELATAALDVYQQQLTGANLDVITTTIEDASPFFYAEDYHQHYLAINPNGYCEIGGTGVTCPIAQP